jgi:hypothetical protein
MLFKSFVSLASVVASMFRASSATTNPTVRAIGGASLIH